MSAECTANATQPRLWRLLRYSAGFECWLGMQVHGLALKASSRRL